MADDGKGSAPPTGAGGQPLLSYPTDYPLKVIGTAADGFALHVRSVIEGAAPGIALGEATTRPSSGGKYLSVTLDARLESEDQRRAIYEALKADPRVVYYL
jgi:putative lipoic acid-binding regulatory protein